MPSPIGTLYIVATPIGNLGDWTFRAVETAKQVDLIACEDTRVTRKLLSHYGIATPTASYHEHNADREGPKLLAMLQAGKNIALMSDAGTPLISDPGYRLVKEAQEADLPVVAVPGPSSVMAALSIAGLPTDRFFFAGFLPAKREARKKAIAKLKTIPATLLYFETAERIHAALEDLLTELGNRPAAIARELTKLHEEVLTGGLKNIAEQLTEENTRGEMVILIAPPEHNESGIAPDLQHTLAILLKDHSIKDAARLAAEITGKSRNEAYDIALLLKDKS